MMSGCSGGKKPKKNPNMQVKRASDQNSVYRGAMRQAAPPNSNDTLLSSRGSTFQPTMTPASKRPQMFSPPNKLMRTAVCEVLRPSW
uniref:Uncharacterized protein n=1 Tax=Arion vulgaris TaxID=1028688 RepID=A0A0B7BUF2_9EUPU